MWYALSSDKTHVYTIIRGGFSMKKILNHIFIDGLSGMAQGLFATLIIGTIIQQIGTLIGGSIGDTIDRKSVV